MLEHAQVVKRMDLARDERRKPAHPRLAHGVRGQQRWTRIFVLEVLDDSERLVKPDAVVELERGQQSLRIDFRVFGPAMLAFGEMHAERLVPQVLHV